MIVHFPIALILAGFLAEMVYSFVKKERLFSEMALWLLSFGAVSAIFAYVSGAFLTRELYGGAGSVQSLHELFAELTVISSLVAAAFKIYLKMEGKETGLLKWIVFAVYGLTAVLVIITGHFGGILVYRHLIPAVY